jgi:hypothetical protein
MPRIITRKHFEVLSAVCAGAQIKTDQDTARMLHCNMLIADDPMWERDGEDASGRPVGWLTAAPTDYGLALVARRQSCAA